MGPSLPTHPRAGPLPPQGPPTCTAAHTSALPCSEPPPEPGVFMGLLNTEDSPAHRWGGGGIGGRPGLMQCCARPRHGRPLGEEPAVLRAGEPKSSGKKWRGGVEQGWRRRRESRGGGEGEAKGDGDAVPLACQDAGNLLLRELQLAQLAAQRGVAPPGACQVACGGGLRSNDQKGHGLASIATGER